MFSACAGVTQLQEIHPTWVFKGGIFTCFFMEFLLPICGRNIFWRNLTWNTWNPMAPWVVKGKGASFKELGGGPNKFGTITQTGTDGGGDALRFLTTHLNHQIPHVFWGGWREWHYDIYDLWLGRQWGKVPSHRCWWFLNFRYFEGPSFQVWWNMMEIQPDAKKTMENIHVSRYLQKTWPG